MHTANSGRYTPTTARAIFATAHSMARRMILAGTRHGSGDLYAYFLAAGHRRFGDAAMPVVRAAAGCALARLHLDCAATGSRANLARQGMLTRCVRLDPVPYGGVGRGRGRTTRSPGPQHLPWLAGAARRLAPRRAGRTPPRGRAPAWRRSAAGPRGGGVERSSRSRTSGAPPWRGHADMCLELRRADVMRHRAVTRATYVGFLARRLDRRRLLLRAWALARAAALRSGAPPWTLIGHALTTAWQERRRHLAALFKPPCRPPARQQDQGALTVSDHS